MKNKPTKIEPLEYAGLTKGYLLKLQTDKINELIAAHNEKDDLLESLQGMIRYAASHNESIPAEPKEVASDDFWKWHEHFNGKPSGLAFSISSDGNVYINGIEYAPVTKKEE